MSLALTHVVAGTNNTFKKQLRRKEQSGEWRTRCFSKCFVCVVSFCDAGRHDLAVYIDSTKLAVCLTERKLCFPSQQSANQCGLFYGYGTKKNFLRARHPVVIRSTHQCRCEECCLWENVCCVNLILLHACCSFQPAKRKKESRSSGSRPKERYNTKKKCIHVPVCEWTSRSCNKNAIDRAHHPSPSSLFPPSISTGPYK